MFNDSSLKDVRGRLRPKTVTARGNYRRTVINAGLWTFNDPQYEQDPIAVGEDRYIVALLFLQDYPIYQMSRMRWPSEIVTLNLNPGPGTVDVPYEQQTDFFDAPSIGSTLVTGFNQILIPDTVGEIGMRQHAKGLTPTNGVRVSGYPVGASAAPKVPRTEDPMGFIEAISAGAILDGHQLWSGTIDDQTAITWQIILDERYYTQAICDAGDVIDYNIGPFRAILDVVGIWSLYVPPIIP